MRLTAALGAGRLMEGIRRMKLMVIELRKKEEADW